MRADIAFTACPYCGAARRTPCFRPDGTPLRYGPHAARTHAYSTSPEQLPADRAANTGRLVIRRQYKPVRTEVIA
ncbi:hypothetical protein [Nocardia wallacei]|uniref:hypothetical protein n=1 Tax=Nocardia wallacei TaxID=480035 RepID=UPI002455833F|nr:hypothetical protein [Nocardia wallacei]